MNAEEYAKALQSGPSVKDEVIAKGKVKVRTFTNRRFMLTAYRIHIVRGRAYTKRMATFTVSANLKSKKIADLKKMGYCRVDCVEIETTVNEKIGKTIKSRKMEFAQQFFAAANNKSVPKAIQVAKPNNPQKTIAWELFDNVQDAWLDNRPIVKVSDRRAKAKAERIRNARISYINSLQNMVEDE